ncbi:DEAD/DEAH box helicase [Rubeoparvulum massiliense]|uniref:DEAD/DEAH box helicase n=1 Tax=Rubeoparvulum massiliense TaxID=1631346 RepID=UPI00065DC702|nr:DEAD/DEAH box helicase [Rubeoparvulum massiliense]
MNRLTGKAENLDELITKIQGIPELMEQVTHWLTVPAQPARTVPFPNELHPFLRKTLEERGIHELYTHQAQAFAAVLAGKHVVTVTPTASGKTMCYNLPVLQGILKNPDARALYLFPTKALAQDQLAELQSWIELMGVDIRTHTYDGDTPPNIRQVIRKGGHIVITNPDMLHSAILPHHTKWIQMFENLHYIVIDEVHSYRGVFGSHVANVLRRLKRIARYYGSDPQIICASATIANPQEHVERLIEEPVQVINDNGAPRGEKHFVFYNPPVVNPTLGIRRSSLLEAQQLAALLLKNEIQTIVFARSRVQVELLLTYLQALTSKELGSKRIRGYRGGYLPKLRREIERGLRSGEIQGVVSTNALELGIDIGQLQACVLTGYPGSIASTWQQAGRAGRRMETSIVFLVASSNPLDQFVIQHPDFFLEGTPEQARINPDNLIILVDHVKCAAYELPFEEGESFGTLPVDEVAQFLVEEGILHHSGARYYWSNSSFPAHNISLRSTAQENVVIIDITITGQTKVLGEVDRFSALTLVHEEAIYLHEGVQYQVEKLDYEEKKAYVRQVDVDYYTDANLAVQLKVLEEFTGQDHTFHASHYGDVTVNAMATIFKKIKFNTHENIGSGPIHLPEQEIHTSSYWIALKAEELQELGWSEDRLRQALVGVAHLLQSIAPLYVMSDPMDIRVVAQVKAVHSGLPTIFFYDRYPGGVGLSEHLFQVEHALLQHAIQLIKDCGCSQGCPSCTGPVEETGLTGKGDALHLLKRLVEG